MISVKVYFENGESLITQINGDLEVAKQYYLNNVFNIGRISDNLQKCIKIEEV